MKQLNFEYSSNYISGILKDQKIIDLLSSTDKSIFFKSIKVSGASNLIIEKIKIVFDSYCRIQQVENWIGVIDFPNTKEYIGYYTHSNTTEFVLYGTQEFIDKYEKTINENFSLVNSYIDWVYQEDGTSITTPLNTDLLPINSMYPFLGDETLEQFYQRFLDSNANILLLIGPVGCAKTTFIRGLLHYAKTSAMVSYDPKILERDHIFANFISDADTNFLILEDSDTFLSARSEGNTMMHRFLNISDGLVSAKNKKIIFSTNLPSIRDVDEALLRPGRNFATLKFELLTKDQALKLTSDLNITLSEDKDKYSIAEIFYHSNKSSSVNQSFGFNRD